MLIWIVLIIVCIVLFIVGNVQIVVDMVLGSGCRCSVILVIMLSVFLDLMNRCVRLQLVDDLCVCELVFIMWLFVSIVVRLSMFLCIVLQCMVLVFDVWVVVILLMLVLVFGLIGKNRLVLCSVLLSVLCVMFGLIVMVRFLVLIDSMWFILDRLSDMLLCIVSRWFLSDELVLYGISGMLQSEYSDMILCMLLVLCVNMMVLGSCGLNGDLLWL